MTASVRSAEDVVNNALERIGFRGRVENMREGTPQARAALSVYAQTRDQLLRQDDWDFADRTIDMVLLKQAPPGGYVPGIRNWDPDTDPPIPWIYEYEYPDDCLKVRAVKRVPLLIPNYDPQPFLWTVSNDDTYTPAKKVVLCNLQASVLIYTAQITDPAQWEPDFAEAFAAALGRRLAPTLTSLEATKLAAADESAALKVAETEHG